MNIEWSEKVNGFVRPDTLDEYVFKEIKPSYKCLELCSKDVVLDIGANIGAFTKYALELGAEVHAYEPEEENYLIMLENINSLDAIAYANKKVLTERCAVVGDDSKSISLYVNSKKNKGLHMTRPVRGREGVEVEAKNFDEIITSKQPNKIKIDVEGGEYSFMPTVFPDCVEKLAMELHFQYNKEWRGMAVKIHEDMLSQGFSVIREPKFTGGNWTTLAGYSR
tara:strand:- start:692 stop:1360 length:669 start_codon:yes stop_codon:yes gene_type:complete